MSHARHRVNRLITIALIAAALASYLVARRQQEESVATFSQNMLKHVEQIARDGEEDFHYIADALRFAAQMLRQPTSPPIERTRELSTYLAVVKRNYRMLQVFDARGRLALNIVDPLVRPPFDPAPFGALMTEAARKAAEGPPGTLFTSRGLSACGGWFQAISLAWGAEGRSGEGGVIVLLVDHSIPLTVEQHRARAANSRLLVLDDHGEPISGQDEPLRQAALRAQADHDEQGGAARMRELLQRMTQRGMGTLILNDLAPPLPRSIDRLWYALGLGAPRLVAAFAPIATWQSQHWSVARLTTPRLLSSEFAKIHLQLLGAYALVASLLLWIRSALLSATLRGAAMRERLRQAEQLAHLHEKTDKILDNIPTGVMSLSSEGRITSLNRCLRDRVPAAAIGHGLREAFPDAPASVIDRLDALRAEALGAGAVRSLFGEKVVLFSEEGQYNLHAVPLEPRFPEARVLLVIEDLSAVQSLTTQLLRAEKLATIGLLAASIAHEIGTPLSIVRGRAEYQLSKLGLAHPQAGGSRIIMEQIDLVSSTLRQLLDFARTKVVKVRAVALHRVASAVEELLRFEAHRRRAALHIEVQEDLPLLAADPDQLQQVLVNLILNACDAVAARDQERAEPGAVHVSASYLLPALHQSGPSSLSGRRPRSQRAACLEIRIRDNGCGISPQHRLQVFDPFFTTKKRGQGTGLGLSIVAQIVRDHGGSIDLESQVDRGTQVIVCWPTAPSSEGSLLESQRSPSAPYSLRKVDPRGGLDPQ